ncbi:hypothetical protein C8J57DRAFT_1317654 [Mycena rebaudengoi]|nr:hypothetical protein C8J57DRAFT_1317654 [Mycena rebaudengoi]
MPSPAHAGVMPAILPKNTPSLRISERLALWKVFYAAGLLHMSGAGTVTGIALSLAAYFSTEPSLRKVLIAAALSSFSTALFTFISIMPVNNELTRMGVATQNLDVNSAEGKLEEQLALKKLDQWRSLNGIRMAIGTVPWLLTLIVVVAPDSIVRAL